MLVTTDDGYGSMGRSNASLGSLSSNSDNSPANSPYSSQYLDNQHHQSKCIHFDAFHIYIWPIYLEVIILKILPVAQAVWAFQVYADLFMPY